MTKAELIAKLADVSDKARVAIDVPNENGGVWHRDIVECVVIKSELYKNGVEVHLGTQPFWTKE